MNKASTSRVASLVCGAVIVAASSAALAGGVAGDQTPKPTTPSNAAPATPATAPAPPAGVPTPPGYVIGPDDVLSVVVWRESDMSADATVRPDGMISVPVINEVKAAGLTPEELRTELTKLASKYVAEPSVSVVVKAIRSRNVFITGQVLKPGRYPLSTPTTVLQLIATAGGLAEYADAENIRIVRIENGRTTALKFNYEWVSKGKALWQNVELKPGDTIVVP